MMPERERLISCLLYGLFIMDLSMQSINWSADNLKNMSPAIQSGDTSQRIPFLTTVNCP